MSYIITFFDRPTFPRLYRFPKKVVVGGRFLTAPEIAVNIMNWVDDQPLAKAMRGQGIIWAYTDRCPSSVTVRDLSEDEIILLLMAGTPDIRILPDTELHMRERPLHNLSTDGTNYKRLIAKKRAPETYDIVKRKSRRL